MSFLRISRSFLFSFSLPPNCSEQQLLPGWPPLNLPDSCVGKGWKLLHGRARRRRHRPRSDPTAERTQSRSQQTVRFAASDWNRSWHWLAATGSMGIKSALASFFCLCFFKEEGIDWLGEFSARCRVILHSYGWFSTTLEAERGSAALMISFRIRSTLMQSKVLWQNPNSSRIKVFFVQRSDINTFKAEF